MTVGPTSATADPGTGGEAALSRASLPQDLLSDAVVSIVLERVTRQLLGAAWRHEDSSRRRLVGGPQPAGHEGTVARWARHRTWGGTDIERSPNSGDLFTLVLLAALHRWFE